MAPLAHFGPQHLVGASIMLLSAVGCRADRSVDTPDGASVETAHSQQPVRLAASDGSIEKEFTRLRGIRELADGRVLVTDEGENRLFVVDFKTGGSTPLGAVGSGPKEYRTARDLFALPGDSTFMADPMNGFRWLVFHGAEIVGTLAGDKTPFGSMAPSILGASGKGDLLVELHPGEVREVARPVADSLLLVRVTVRTGKRDTIGLVRSRYPQGAFTYGNFIGIPDGRDAKGRSPARIGMGDLAVIFPDGWIAIARTRPYRVDWRNPKGGLTVGQPLDQPVEWALADRQAYLRAESRHRGITERQADQLTDWPMDRPAFSSDLAPAVVALPNGQLAIRQLPRSGVVETRYDLVGRNGKRVGQLTMPPSNYLVGVGIKHLYVVTPDSNGVQKLTRHPMKP